MDEVVKSESEVVEPVASAEPVAAVEPAAEPVTEVKREIVSAEEFAVATFQVDNYRDLSALTGLPEKTCYTRYSQLKKKGLTLNKFKGATGKGGRKKTDIAAINARIAEMRAKAESAPTQ